MTDKPGFPEKSAADASLTEHPASEGTNGQHISGQGITIWVDKGNSSLRRLLDSAAGLASLQRRLAENAASTPTLMHRHVRDTLRRCLPCGVTEDQVERCLQEVSALSEKGDPMHTGAIHAFAAKELLTLPPNPKPLQRKLYSAAVRRLKGRSTITRDDLRLVALDALFDPSILQYSPHAGFFRLRLGLHGSPACSCEEIACLLHIPLTRVYEIETAALQTLTMPSRFRRFPDA